MKRVGIVMHGSRPAALEVARTLVQRLVERGIEVQASTSDAARLELADVVAAATFPEGADIVFSLGGDGTLLRAAEQVFPHGIPLLGVNLGHLGFLSELERDELQGGLMRILDDGFDVEERSVLRGSIVDQGVTREVFALNDIIIAKVDVGRAIRLALSIDGEPLITWSADGVIVSTATGSTAYSFSAGGPILSPRVDAMLITPVAPHGLFDRTIVVAPDEEIAIGVLPDQDEASLSADGGPALPLSPDADVRITTGGRMRLAKIEPAPFWRLLREKFHLPPGD